MEEAIADKLARYYATPGDAPVAEKFDGRTEADFECLERYLDSHQPKTREESVRLEQDLAAGVMATTDGLMPLL